MDFVYVGLTLAFFVLSWGFVRLCASWMLRAERFR